MIKEIQDLYDNFLARFKFFRNFIRVLTAIVSDMEKTKEILTAVDERVKVLEKELADIKEILESKESSNSDPKLRTAHSIMDEYKSALTDKNNG